MTITHIAADATRALCGADIPSAASRNADAIASNCAACRRENIRRHGFPIVPLGRLAITRGVLMLLDEETQRNGHAARALRPIMARHACMDWGDVPPEDAALNDAALFNGARLLSAYTWQGARVWIITEADRSHTTVLLPEEY